jgi:hypothetical protein
MGDTPSDAAGWCGAGTPARLRLILILLLALLGKARVQLRPKAWPDDSGFSRRERPSLLSAIPLTRVPAAHVIDQVQEDTDVEREHHHFGVA